MRFLRSAWIAERVPGTRAALRLAVVVVGFHAVASCQPPAESARANPADPLPPAVQAPPSIYPQLALLLPAGPPPTPIPTIHPTVTVLDDDDFFGDAVSTQEWHEDGEYGDTDGQWLATSLDGDTDGEAPGAGSEMAGEAPHGAVVLEMLGERVEPGSFMRLTWAATETFAGNDVPAAVLVAHGTRPGPTLCLTAAIHGDELNGIETVRRVLHQIDPGRLTGTVIGVPIVNIQGFQRSSRYLPDRRDLNRFFPGNARGSAASRIANSLFSQIVLQCSALVDLHTGSFHRTNLPQLRADLNDERVVELTQGFGSTVILHSPGAEGTLRGAATAAGIPAVTLEAGMPLQVQEDAVNHSVKGIFTLLDTMKMYGRRSLWGNPEPIYYQSRWVRADHGGILAGNVKLGRRVKPGDVLGTVIDPISNEQNDIVSPFQGRVIGMALDQFVMPGYATFHIGIEAEVAQAAETPIEDDIDHASDDYEGAMDDAD
jgi:uncharacterized protein